MLIAMNAVFTSYFDLGIFIIIVETSNKKKEHGLIKTKNPQVSEQNQKQNKDQKW